MGVFVVLLLVPMMIQHIEIRGYYNNFEKKNKTALLFFFFFFTILIMFRHESIGNDTHNYIYFFNKLSKLEWSGVAEYPLEIGYSFYNKIITLFTKEPRFFLAVTAVIITAMIYPTYQRLCIDSSLTIVLFSSMATFVMMFSGIRQMLAIGIGFIAYEFTRKKKLVTFITMVCIAMTFHTSAFILVFMYPLYHVKITKKWLFAVIPALIAVFIFNKQIFSVLSYLIERYTNYDATVTKTDSYTMILLFAVFAVFAFLIPDEQYLDQETVGLRNFLLFSLALQMFAPLHTVAMRMNYYYIIFIPLLMPKIVHYRGERWRQVAVAGRHVMVIFFFLYFFVSANGEGKLHVFPYHFFWENIS